MTTKKQGFSLFSKLTRSLSIDYLEALNSPVSLRIALYLKYGMDEEACSVSIHPLWYNDKHTFAADYLAASYLSKFRESSESTADSRKAQSLLKFWSCEDYLRDCKHGFDMSIRYLSTDIDVSNVLYIAREKISHILGRVRTSFDVNSCNFGPGSSTSISSHKAHPSKKFLSSNVTAGCKPFVEWFFQDIGFPEPDLSVRESSRISIVPKNFKSDRIIAIEPDWNIFFQKGAGAAIRERLMLFGYNLDTLAVHHGKQSLIGSITSFLSTLDLSSASDSISTYLIRFLLPDDWFFLLNSLRTDRVEIDGKDTPLIKFSSMGNGFTFELESLVFLALSLAVETYSQYDTVTTTFGDDIICHTDLAPLLVRVLTVCGFRLNSEKSYTTSYFRESCGSHFFDGKDVKPFYLKRNLSNDAEKFKFCNSIRRTAFRLTGCDIFDTNFRIVYNRCKCHIRRVFYIPEGYGDGGLIESFDAATPTAIRSKERDIRRYPNCIQGYKVRCLLPVAQKGSDDQRGMLIHKIRSSLKSYVVLPLTFGIRAFLRLYPISVTNSIALDPLLESEGGNTYSLRSSKTKYRIGFMNVFEWTNPSV